MGDFVNIEDDPSPAGATPAGFVSIEDDPQAAPAMTPQGNFRQESAYSGWLDQNRDDMGGVQFEGTHTDNGANENGHDNSLTIDPYGNGVSHDLRGLWNKYSSKDPITGQVDLKPTNAQLDEFALPGQRGFTAASRYAKGVPADKLGSWNDDHTEYHRPGWQPTSVTEKIMAGATKMAGDAYNAAGEVAADPSLVAQTAGKVGYAAAQGIGTLAHKGAEEVNLAAGTAPMAWDAIKSRITGVQTTAAQDAWFRSTVDPLTESDDAFDLAKNASFPEKAAHMFGDMASQLSAMILTGGEAQAPGALDSGLEALRKAVAHGSQAAFAPAMTSATDTARKVYAETGDGATAAKAAQVDLFTNMLGAVVPLHAPGGAIRRMAQGAASGATVGEASREAQNAVLPQNMQTPLTAEGVALNAAGGALIAGVGGRSAQPRVQDADFEPEPGQAGATAGDGGPGDKPFNTDNLKGNKPYDRQGTHFLYTEALKAAGNQDADAYKAAGDAAGHDADAAEAYAAKRPDDAQAQQDAKDARQAADALQSQELYKRHGPKAKAEANTGAGETKPPPGGTGGGGETNGAETSESPVSPETRPVAALGYDQQAHDVASQAHDAGEIKADGNVVTVKGEPVAHADTPADAEALAESAQQKVDDRRVDLAGRKTVDDMTPDELRAALKTHELTGLPNKRAFDESAKQPVQVHIDLDSLKAVNDTAGHEAGDKMLQTAAQAMKDTDPNAFHHISGDEFRAQAQTPEEAHALMGRLQANLAKSNLELPTADGQTFKMQGIGASYGVGGNKDEAEAALQAHKASREASGERAARGEMPKGATLEESAEEPLNSRMVQLARSQVDKLHDALRSETKLGLGKVQGVDPENPQHMAAVDKVIQGQFGIKGATPEARYKAFSAHIATLADDVRNTAKQHGITDVSLKLNLDRAREVHDPKRLFGALRGLSSGMSDLQTSLKLKETHAATAAERAEAAKKAAEAEKAKKPAPTIPGKKVKVLGQEIDKPANPTEAQKKAGNYAKPTVEFNGLPIKVENVSGGYRSGHDSRGKAWKTRFKDADYGYFEGTKAGDGGGVDVFMGKGKDFDRAYVIDQMDKTGKTFDEHKVVVGVDDQHDAKALYLRHYPKNWKGLGGITELTAGQLKVWLKTGDMSRPIGSGQQRIKRGAAPDPRYDSILEYLARHSRGINLEEAKAEGIDKPNAHEAAVIGDRRAFRKNGMTFDEAAEHLSEAGYPVGDDRMPYSKNVLLDKIMDELRGQKVHSTHYELFDRDHPESFPEELPNERQPREESHLDEMTQEELETRLAKLREIYGDDVDPDIPFSRPDDFKLTAPGGNAGEQAKKQQRSVEAQQDLFGDKTAIANEIAKVKAALERKLSTGQVSPETGNPGDLFSEARKQTEIPEGEHQATDKEIETAKQAAKDRLAVESREGWSPVARELDREFTKRDDKFWNVEIDKDGQSKFVDSEFSGVQCTGFANAVLQKLGKDRVKVMGFSGDENPKSKIGADSGGHDFALVDGRYIVDPWLAEGFATPMGKEHLPERGVFDLENPDDKKLIEYLYGDRAAWKDMTDKMPGAKAKPETIAGRLEAIEKELGIKKAGDLEDAGEKIGGARKDVWAARGLKATDLDNMTEAEGATHATKHQVWKPDWSKLITDGMEPKAAALSKIAWDKLGARPRMDTSIGRRQYVETLSTLADIIKNVKTEADARGLQTKLAEAIGYKNSGYSIARTPEEHEARDKFWSIHKGRRSVLSDNYHARQAADKLLATGWPGSVEPWTRHYRVGQGFNGPNDWVAQTKDRKQHWRFKTEAEAKEFAANRYAEELAKGKGESTELMPERPHLDSIERVGPPVREGNATSQKFVDDFGFRGLEFGNWAADDERQKLLNHAYDAMQDLARILDIPPKALSLNGTLGLALGARGKGRAAAHYEPDKLVINMTKINGAGSLAHEWAHALDHYMGEYGRPTAYGGHAQGASGWYADPTSRTLAHLRPEIQAAWKGVIEAMFQRDRTKAEHVRDIELSLEKRKATLQTQRERLAKAETAGTPDPTFIKRLQDWIADNDRSITAGERLLEAKRAQPDEPGAYGKIPTNYKRNAEILSGKQSGIGYWRRPTEMFARAFESFVQDKIAASEGKSQYLVHGTEADLYENRGYKANPYPNQDRPAINAAIQKLVDALETRQEGGKEILFSRPETTSISEDNDTRYEISEPTKGKSIAKRNVRSSTAVPQLDLFANADRPGPAAQAARLAQSVRLTKVGAFRSGHAVIDTWQKAAHVVAALRKSPQEIMAALVLDKDQKPLAVIRHTLGEAAASQVEVWSLTGAVAHVPGAASVYFAHNHPAGNVLQSVPWDHDATLRLTNLLKGTGIEPKGMIVVGAGSKEATYHEPMAGLWNWDGQVPYPIEAGGKTKSLVPLLGRRFAKVLAKTDKLQLTTRAGVTAAVTSSGEKSGVMLLNHQHRVVGMVPMDPAAMRKLRTGDAGTGAAALLRHISEANSNVAVPFGPAPAARNVGVFLNAAHVRVLDTIVSDTGGSFIPGEEPAGTNYFARHPAGLDHVEGGATGGKMPVTAENVRAAGQSFIDKFGMKPELHVFDRPEDALNDPNIGPSLMARGADNHNWVAFLKDGKIYIAASAVHHLDAVPGLIAHEMIVHYGLRAMFPAGKGEGGYRAILDGVKQGFAGEVERRGLVEYGEGYDHNNRAHTDRAAEEVLAYYSQKYQAGQDIPSRMRRFLDRLYGMIRDFGRRVMGLAPKFDEVWMRRVLTDLEGYLRKGKGGGVADEEAAYSEKGPTWYSAVERAAEGAKRDKGTGAEWEATLRNTPGVKGEEMQWLGLKDWLEGQGKVSKQQVLEYIRANKLELGETTYGEALPGRRSLASILDELSERGYSIGEDTHGDPVLHVEGNEEPVQLDSLPPETRALWDEVVDRAETEEDYDSPADQIPTKYSQYKLEGGTNYREKLLTLPVGKAASAKVLEGRKAIFDKYKPQLEAIDKAMDDYLMGRRTAQGHTDLVAILAERDKIEQQRDEEADRVAGPIPVYKDYGDPHWPDINNPVVHIRSDDRVLSTGERTRHLAEIQSGWHQTGRKKGYAGDLSRDDARKAALLKREMDRVNKYGPSEEDLAKYFQPGKLVRAYGSHHDRVVTFHPAEDRGMKTRYQQEVPSERRPDMWVLRDISEEDASKLRDEGQGHLVRETQIPDYTPWSVTVHEVDRAGNRAGPDRRHSTSPAPEIHEQLQKEWRKLVKPGAPPDAPFKTTWHELALKRALRQAVEEGFDALSWDTGITNAQRYNLSQRVGALSLDRDNVFHATGLRGEHLHSESAVTPERLEALVGKDIAQRLIDQPYNEESDERQLSGLDLDMGSKGMVGFYDKMLPAFANKYVKKWGGKVERGEVGGGDREAYLQNSTQHLADMARAQNLRVVAVRPGEQVLRLVERVDGQDRSFTPTPGGELAQALVAHNEKANHTEPPGMPAHIIRFTPAMRESVMAGQPMFARRANPPPLPPGAGPSAADRGTGGGKGYDLVRRAVVGAVDSELMQSIRKIVAPRTVSATSEYTARLTIPFLGELAQQQHQAVAHLEQFERAVGRLSRADQLAMIDAIENSRPQPIPGMQPVADELRKMLDQWRDAVHGLGDGYLRTFIEGYFPHYWRDPDEKSNSVFASIMGRRPMRGPATFLKQRVYATMKDGMDAGLTPVTTNPLIQTLLKVSEMQRFVSGVTMFKMYKDVGLAKFIKASEHVPDGWTAIDDAIARVSSWSEESGGWVKRGVYAMPNDGARIINNHLSGSQLRNFAPAVTVRAAANALNALQLGFSAFHLGFTTLDAIISKTSLGFERLANGEPARAAASFLEAATGPGAAILNLVKGRRMLNAYANPAGATPLMQAIIRGLTAGGGRVTMDRYYRPDRNESPFHGIGMVSLARDIKAALTAPQDQVMELTKAIGSFPIEASQELWRSISGMVKEYPFTFPLEMAGRICRASTSIIMEHIVPLQKLGVAHDMILDYLRRNPNADPLEFNEEMQSIWRTVDNRLGEMVYNNRFWNRTFKDAMHLTFRAVGWNTGTQALLLGGVVDPIKALDKLIRTGKVKPTDFGHSTSYLIAMGIVVAMVGSYIQYLRTGKWPENAKDAYFPRTGDMTKMGTPERMSLPSYAKDVYEMGTQPFTTFTNKLNPFWGEIYRQWTGNTFFGDKYVDPDADLTTRLKQHGQQLKADVMPFSIQGGKQFQDPSLKWAPYVGGTPAPASVTSPEQMERRQRLEDEKSYEKNLSYQLYKAREKHDAAEVQRLQEELAESKRHARETNREYRQEKQAGKKGAPTSGIVDHIGPIIDGSSSRADMAAKVQEAGYPALAGLLGSLPPTLRPQVLNQLRKYA